MKDEAYLVVTWELCDDKDASQGRHRAMFAVDNVPALLKDGTFDGPFGNQVAKLVTRITKKVAKQGLSNAKK